VAPSLGLLWLANLSATMHWWWPWPPVAIALYVLWERYRWRRAAHGRSKPTHLLSLLHRNGRLLTFCDLLALLIEHGTPLHEAVELAASASGDPRLSSASHQFAANLQQGNSQMTPGFPPLVGLALTTTRSQAQLVHILRRLAMTYERAAGRDANWLRFYLPSLLTIVIGGGSVVFATCAFLGPWYHILRVLSEPGAT
jgi:type II secretory pathway component PulF